jgi:hypothetical protein
MIRTKLFNRNLNRIIPEFQETDNNSPNFINVTFVQDTYTSGKNIFKIKPNYKNIQKNSIDYEILDINGNTIYHNKLQYTDDDGSEVIAIHIYENTPIGNAAIYFVGRVNVDLAGNTLLPSQNRQNNYRYINRLHIDRSKRNDSDIIFVTEPRFVVYEKKAHIVEEKFTNNKLTTIYGTGSYLLINDSPTILEGDGTFKSEMETGTLSFPVLSDNYFPKQKYEIPNFAYSSRIRSIVSPVQLILETPLYVSSSVGSNANIKKGVTKIQSQPYSIEYYQNPTERNTTQNEKPYAKIDIENMEAGTGQVSRVKVFTKSAVKPQSEYQLVYDSELYSKNILVDDTTSLIEYPIGIFNGNTNVVSGPSFYSSSFNAVNYWNVIRLNGAPSASKSTNSSYLSNAISILPTASLSGSQELMLEQTGSVRIPFWKDTSYTLKFDYYLTKNVLDTRDSKLDVYISGSSFVNNNELGYFLGSVPTHKGSLSIVRDYTIPIKPNSDGDGILRFVMRDGTKIANIRVQENVERGFSSNRTKLYVPITNEHKNEYLDFKIQFFNYTLKEANREFVVKNSFFAGGNQYIVGDTNIITGSTFVASYSSSGIELYGNISGSKSGSAIQTYGYKGIEYTLSNSPTSSNYGWSLTQGNPYSSASYSTATVQMINQSGSRFEFRSNPDTFNFNAVGSNSTVLIGNSGSVSSSYLKWDGTNLVIYVSGSLLSPTSGSGGFSATASYAATASYLLNGGANIKADIVSGASFTGTPRTSTVVFPSAYEDNFYAVSISAESARAWTVESKTLSGFTINSNASDVVSGNVYWMTMPKSSSFIATRDIVTSASYAATASFLSGTVATASFAINFTGVAVAALSAISASYAATASSLSNSGGNITITGGTTYDNLYFGGTLSQSIEASVSGLDAGAVNLYFGPTTGLRDYRFAWQNDRNVVLYGAGGIAVWSTGTATSDYILKRNIKPTEMDGIDTLKKINVIDFQWKADTDLHDGGVIHTGFVAQEIENVIPDAVYSPSGSTKLLHKEELVPTLVKALQEAVHRIEELEKRLLVSDN